MSVGKSSLKRSKPNYIYSIIGVALVLLIMGIIGWFFVNSQQIAKSYKEDIKINVYLTTSNKDTIGQIQQFIASQPYSKNVKYINKEEAKKIWNKENNEDWASFIEGNPLPESIEFNTKAEYVNNDSLTVIAKGVSDVFPSRVSEVKFPSTLVGNLDATVKKAGIVFLIITIVLSIIVVFLIDNTIRLAMFSNRFLIKTMQMVGATRGFIVKPMNIRAAINGLISGGIAVVLLAILIEWAEKYIPYLSGIRSTQSTFLLFGGMILVGVLISLYSTHRSVIKYLKMKLDDLY